MGIGSAHAANAWNYMPLFHPVFMRATPTVSHSVSNEATWGSTASAKGTVARDQHWSSIYQKSNAAVLDIYLGSALTLNLDAEL